MYSTRPGGRRYRPVLDRLPLAMSGAVALVAGACLALGLSLVAELHAGWFGLVAYTALCGLLGAFSRPGAVPLIAGAAWLFHNGFAEHRYAEVVWSGGEAAHLALFAVAALATSLPLALPRRRIRLHRLPVPDRTGATEN